MARGQKSEVGATRVAPNGYHYTKAENGEWRLTHHIVAEEKIGRRIRAHERVWFEDGDRQNLAPDNLLVTEGQGKEKKIAMIKDKIAQLELQLADLENDQ